MGGGAGRGFNFGATLGSGQLPLMYETKLPPTRREVVPDSATRHREIFPGCTTKLNEDAQGKHILTHKNYQAGRSHLTISMERAQQLVDKYGGSGRKINKQTKELVDFHETIGVYLQQGKEEGPPTRYGMIHYGKRGCHIVPASPEQD